MAPTRKTKAAGKGRKTQVLGKRPGEQPGKSTPESLPKRSKLTTDSHPAAGTRVKQDKSKPSLSDIDNDVDKENISPDDGDVDDDFVLDDDDDDDDDDDNWEDETAEDQLIDDDLEIPAAHNGILEYDSDHEDPVDYDEVDGEQAVNDANSTKAAICEKEMREWIEEDEADDQLLSLPAEARNARIENCEFRFSFILTALVMTAHSISKSDFEDWAIQKTLPLTFKWWVFFITIAVDKILAILMASISDRVKVILGGPLSFEELLLLPDRWRECTWWGVYTDILRDHVDDSEYRYVGSATSKLGAKTRLNGYEMMMNGGKLEKGDHCKMLGRKDVDKNFRLFAYFNKYTTTKPYPLLMEFCCSILLQSFLLRPSHWLNPAVIAMIERATPEDVPHAQHGGLNLAAQCLQGLYHRQKPEDLICKNCQRKDSNQWYSFNPGVPFSNLLCIACYSYRCYHDGEERPLYLEERRRLQVSLGKPPPVGQPCPGCTRSCPSWLLPRAGPWKLEAGRLRWECPTCAQKPTHKLRKRDKSVWDRKAAIKLLPAKPKANAICPGCQRFYTNTRYWLPPQGEFLKEPLRQRYECPICAKAPTNKLGTGWVYGDRAAFMRTLTKPKPPAACPGCQRVFNNTRKWCVPQKPMFDEPLRQRYECPACALKATNVLARGVRKVKGVNAAGLA